jgi:general secretion pathway protein G
MTRTFSTTRARLAAASTAQRGVTLVEVLIVVAIMAMIAGGVAFAILPRMQEARVKTATQGALEIRKMVELWQTENDSSCPSVSQLKKDKYLDKAAASQDPWGTTFEINCTEGTVYVRSAGPDKQAGTKDDIQVPKASDDEEG